MRVKRRERVLVTTLTKRMAEDLTDHLLDEGFKVNYMHSDTATLDRIDIIRDLRTGKIDVLVGINLLREGLDIPEVSLVAILDADKEGFLRNRRSLIQTMGRAARNAHGEVVMYADVVTDSMRIAIDETRRRRALQEKFNEEHGIVPKTVKKSIADISSFIEQAEKTVDGKTRDRHGTGSHGAFESLSADGGAGEGAGQDEDTARAVAEELAKKLPREELTRLMETLESDMAAASEAMDFERAAALRDQLVELRSKVEGTTEDEVMARLKAGARKGSAHATRRKYRPRRK